MNTGKSVNQRGVQEEPYRKLAASVLNQAYADLKSEVRHERSSANRFFTNGNYELWADTLGLNHESILRRYREVVREYEEVENS